MAQMKDLFIGLQVVYENTDGGIPAKRAAMITYYMNQVGCSEEYARPQVKTAIKTIEKQRKIRPKATIRKRHVGAGGQATRVNRSAQARRKR